jgi:hypothetical protein
MEREKIMDQYVLRAAWLSYNPEKERWLPATMADDLPLPKLYILPPDTNPAEGYETGRHPANGMVCCPQYKGRCLPSLDVGLHGFPPMW